MANTENAGIDLIPSNDFSFYDQVLDMSLTVGAIPERYHEVILNNKKTELDLYFAMARGYQKDGLDITAMEMTKWFDTNYHYIVPEFHKNQKFKLFSTKVIDEFNEAKHSGFVTKPVIIGAVSYLLLGKEKEADFDRLDLIKNLLPVYIDILNKLKDYGVEWVQFDEPFLALDLSDKAKEAFQYVYAEIRKAFPHIKIIIANYFDCFGDNLDLALSLPVNVLHLDLVRCPKQLDDILESDKLSPRIQLSLGVVDGRNVWKNDFENSLSLINKAIRKIGKDRILIAPSCSLLHSPCDLDFETDLNPEIKQWLAFAKQKLDEIVTLKQLADGDQNAAKKLEEMCWLTPIAELLIWFTTKSKRTCACYYRQIRTAKSEFSNRKETQHKALNLPLFPTTTIGSFPQTAEVRAWRAKFKKVN